MANNNREADPERVDKMALIQSMRRKILIKKDES